MKRATAIAALFVVGSSFWHTAQAGIEDAMAAYARGDYPTAFELLEEPASNGDKQAQADNAGSSAMSPVHLRQLTSEHAGCRRRPRQ